ncbi:frataxin, mitochondrial-like isoform X2 [Mangifera indica]|uniref:frataxin, mitochondrial-like isoform X2 n=1 Tax=Mangifera indica TaxID=29780 RepID=UPI001CFA11C3|nr:frataxin, mitochondrial-like isoform X2 [Mangifera indica]
MATKFILLRRLSRFVKPYSTHRSSCVLLEHLGPIGFSDNKSSPTSLTTAPRNFCSTPRNPSDDSQVPAAIDYHSLLQEDEFHRLANSTIHDLLEKFEEYGDVVQMDQIDGFDVDYGNEVLTLKLGALGTYVLNKQTPNRQIWLSSPVSGPSRFDWDRSAQAWVYRRTKANLLKTLESELEQLCGEPIDLSSNS